MNGIDISGWQSGINLSIVSCDFVIIKATQGTNYVNPDFIRAYTQAKSAGKCLGLYHYATGEDPILEAEYFLNNIKDYIGEAILCLDWESEQNSQFGTNDKVWCKTWLDYVANKTSSHPLLYISYNTMPKINDIGYELWVAQYANMNNTWYQITPWNEGAYKCAIRQYSSCGRLVGFNGPLDLNKFYGGKTEWNNYIKGNINNVSNAPSGSVLDLVVKVMQGKYGDGDIRKTKLGSRYNEIQDFINHISTASINTLVEEVKNGKYGNGETRKIVLGSRYNEIQDIINEQSNSIYYTVQPNDTLSDIASKYKTTYQKIVQLNNLSNPNLIYPGQKLRIK